MSVNKKRHHRLSIRIRRYSLFPIQIYLERGHKKKSGPLEKTQGLKRYVKNYSKKKTPHREPAAPVLAHRRKKRENVARAGGPPAEKEKIANAVRTGGPPALTGTHPRRCPTQKEKKKKKRTLRRPLTHDL